MLNKIRQRLIDEVGKKWHRLWSVRILLFQLLLDGVATGFMGFYGMVPPWWFLGINVFLTVAAGLARLIKQPELHS
jgi:hypothetical protein